MSEPLAKARAIADAATPGPWEVSGKWWLEGTEHIVVSSEDYEIAFTQQPDAAHIARFDPPTVLAMLDAIELLAEAKLHVPHGTALRADIDTALDRVRTLIEGDT